MNKLDSKMYDKISMDFWDSKSRNIFIGDCIMQRK
jgi:hypothetical protein